MNKNILFNKKGQIAPFMVLIMAVLILAIAATIFIGEAGFNRLRVANVTDGALITATSAFARNLNRIRQIQKGTGGLQVTYIGLQTFLATRISICQCKQPPCWYVPLLPFMGCPMFGVWENIWSPMIQPMFYLSMYNLDKLYKSAVDIADNMPEELRSSLYDSSFGGGLIDEPRPFFEGGDCFSGEIDEAGNRIPVYCPNGDEVLKDEHGRTVGLNYEAYAKRDSQFAEQYREYKKSAGSWYDNNTLSYSFNKSLELEDTGSSEPGNKQKVKCPGQINKGYPTANCPDDSQKEYESYLKVDLDKVPKRVKVEPLPMVLLYFWQLPITFPCYVPPYESYSACYCQTWPAFIPVPKGWIRNIDINTGLSYGLTVQKKMPFKLFPLLNQKSPELKQRSKVRIKGSFSSGYDFKLEE